MWELKLLNSSQKSWSSATCNDLMTSSHLIWDAIQVRCWQNTWTFIARPLNVTPVLIFHLVFPPQFPELGRVDRGAQCSIGKKWGWNRAEQRCEDISIKGQDFSPSFHKYSTAICKIQQVEFLDTKIVPAKVCQGRALKEDSQETHQNHKGSSGFRKPWCGPRALDTFISQGHCACTQVVIPQAHQFSSLPLLIVHPKICSLGWIRSSTETHRAPGENTYQDLKGANSQPVILESYNGKRKLQCSLSDGLRPPFPKILSLLPQKGCHSSLLLQSFQNKLEFRYLITTDLERWGE